MRPLRAGKNLSEEALLRQKYQTVNGVEKGSRERLFIVFFHNTEMNGCEMKLFGSTFKENKRKQFFTQRVIKLGELIGTQYFGDRRCRKVQEAIRRAQGPERAASSRVQIQPGNISHVDQEGGISVCSHLSVHFSRLGHSSCCQKQESGLDGLFLNVCLVI